MASAECNGEILITEWLPLLGFFNSLTRPTSEISVVYQFKFVRFCISAALSAYFSRLKGFQFAYNETSYQINTLLVSMTCVMGPGDRRTRSLHNTHKDLIVFGVNWSRHCVNMGQKVYFSWYSVLMNIPLMCFYKKGWQISIRYWLPSYGLEGKAAVCWAALQSR